MTSAIDVDVESRERRTLFWSVLALAAATVIVGLPLLAGRVLAGHDIVVYLINAQQTAANHREGLFFPAWAGGFNAGYGSPTLMFFPPLTSTLHALPIHLGLPVIVGVCWWSLLGLFCSGAAMLGWLRSTAFARGALPAALVYMVAPYRIIDVYHRSALAEHWAFVWPPLIVWLATNRRLHPMSRCGLVSFSVAALVLSNLPLALLFGAGLAVWVLFSREIRSDRVWVIGGSLIGFLIAAFALVPQALSSSLLSVERYYGPDAGRFRPSANPLFKSGLQVWDFNALVSVACVATFAVVVIAFVMLPRGRRGDSVAQVTLLVAIVLLIVTLRSVGPFWDALPLFSKLQFPWRVAALMTFVAALSTSMLDSYKQWVIVGLVAAISLVSAPWSRTAPMSTFRSSEPPEVSPGNVFPDPHTVWEAGSGGWYWRHDQLAEIWFLAANVRPWLLPDLAGTPAPQLDLIRHRPAVVVGHPESRVSVQRWGSAIREVVIETAGSGSLLWRAISFPSMKVTVDGQSVPTSIDEATGLVKHAVPAGTHVVRWSWEAFPALRWGRWVSIAGCCLGVALLVGGWISTRRSGTYPSRTGTA